MEKDSFLSFLGLAQRAGRLACGFDSVVKSVKAGQSVLILIASDMSAKTIKELCFSLRDSGVEKITVSRTKEQLGRALGRSTGIISVNDRSFAAKIKQMLANDTGEDTI